MNGRRKESLKAVTSLTALKQIAKVNFGGYTTSILLKILPRYLTSCMMHLTLQRCSYKQLFYNDSTRLPPS